MFPYSSFAIPSTFLLWGMLMEPYTQRMADNQYATLALTTTIGLIIPFAIQAQIPEATVVQGNLVLLAGLGIFIALGQAEHYSVRFFFTSLTIIGVFFFLAASGSHIFTPDRETGKDNYMAIITASELIDQRYSGHQYGEFRLWFRKDENYNNFFSLAAVYLYPWGSSLDAPASSKPPHPQLTLASKDKVSAGDALVILSSNGDVDKILYEANQALEGQNVRIAIDQIEIIQQGKISYFIYFAHATKP
jgi:hypothetical protein